MIFKSLVFLGLLSSNVSASLRGVEQESEVQLDLEVIVEGGERQLFPLLPGTKCPTGHHCRVRTTSGGMNPMMGSLKDNLKTPLAAVQAGAGKAYDALKTTHYLNPDTMYYRWNEWNTYSNSWSWFDGNNGRGYGGVAPSQWGDDNVRANQMNSGMNYMKRLFSKPGKGDNFGSTVCAYAWMMPHSTDDHRCGAFFRILNTGTSAKRWTIQWHWTGWSGWGNKASLAVNKANWWSGSCYGICSRSENIEIKADTKGTRINNVVFVNGASHPYYHNNYYRMSYLSFSNTKLPAGLEYVDDLSTATGNWV